MTVDEDMKNNRNTVSTEKKTGLPEITIIVAAHKLYEMPSDPMYLPVHVGAAGKESIGYQRDDEGKNISELNPFFCELTGLYWAWKNLDSDYIGLVHYRRHFAMGGKTLSYEQIQPYLGRVRIFTPKKRWYVIETLKSHYEHTHYPEHLVITREVLAEKHPDYLSSYEKTLSQRWGYMFNMAIMQRDLLNEYCTWLFDVLFGVYHKVDTTDYTAFEKRYVGRVSELLFNVWLKYQLDHNKISNKEIMELKFDVDENMLVKIPAFLKAKFLGKRYGKSF
jgi:hypothetical protein